MRECEGVEAGGVLVGLEGEGALDEEVVRDGLGDLVGWEAAVVGWELAELLGEGREGGGVGCGLGEALVGEVLGLRGVLGRVDGRLEVLRLGPGALGIEDED